MKDDVFLRANDRCRQRAYQCWHQGLAKRHILRAQLGFGEVPASRPAACVGCDQYHGHAYGLRKDQRVVLICAMHPYGWQGDLPCPDWDTGKTLESLSFA